MEIPTYTAIPGRLDMVITQKFDAPRELVYRIYTDAQLIPEWWGPRQLTTTIERQELKPGGIWRYIQRDEQQNIFAFHGVYHSIVPERRIISTFEWEGMPGHVVFVTTNFDDQNGKTIVTEHEIFQSVEDRDGMIQQGMEEGIIEGNQRFNELIERVRTGQAQGENIAHYAGDGGSVRLTREYNATPEQVWEEWTDPELYKCWSGSKDYYTPYTDIDLRVGGKYLISNRGPDGKDIWTTGTYKEIIEPKRLVMTNSFADEHGNIVPVSYYDTRSKYPLEMELDLTLEDLGGRTRLVLEHKGLPSGEIIEQTRQGWSEELDKLGDCLRASR
jgi:uncharacterized protein YndB with AHSA1/START domain